MSKPAPYERLRASSASLAARILADTAESGSPAVLELEQGLIPADLERLMLAYCYARSQAGRWPSGLTEVLQDWRTAALGHYNATGEVPTVATLARLCKRSTTAAHAAIVRLRGLGLWLPEPRQSAAHETPISE